MAELNLEEFERLLENLLNDEISEDEKERLEE